MPQLKLPDFGNLCDSSRPILSFAWEAPGPHRASSHRHARGHIIQVTSGAYWVVTPEGTWLVPQGQAIWIPPGVFHEVYSHDAVSARVLFVDPECAERLPVRSGTVATSHLLTALVGRVVEYGNDYSAQGPAARLARVVLDELAGMEAAPLLIPISKEQRLARAMARLIQDPTSSMGLPQLARHAGASPRTLARLFQDETGMSFTQWRTRLRLVEAVQRLVGGASVTEVALDLGYSSTSGFVFMFRSNLGVSPGRYRAHPPQQKRPHGAAGAKVTTKTKAKRPGDTRLGYRTQAGR